VQVAKAITDIECMLPPPKARLEARQRDRNAVTGRVFGEGRC
jgi:hypothetical protein